MAKDLYQICVTCGGAGQLHMAGILRDCPVCRPLRVMPHGGTAEQFERYRLSHEKLQQEAWRSIAEEIPPTDVPLLVLTGRWTQYGAVFVAFHRGEGLWQTSRTNRLYDAVTHWRPCPDLPINVARMG